MSGLRPLVEIYKSISTFRGPRDFEVCPFDSTCFEKQAVVSVYRDSRPRKIVSKIPFDGRKRLFSVRAPRWRQIAYSRGIPYARSRNTVSRFPRSMHARKSNESYQCRETDSIEGTPSQVRVVSATLFEFKCTQTYSQTDKTRSLSREYSRFIAQPCAMHG